MKDEKWPLQRKGELEMATNEEKYRENFNDRLLDFSVNAILLTSTLRHSYAEAHIAGQLLRCGTSPGANYEEACGAESRADFIHKMLICLKELRESRYWLKVLKKSRLGDQEMVALLLTDADSLCRLFGKSVTTAKNKR